MSKKKFKIHATKNQKRRGIDDLDVIRVFAGHKKTVKKNEPACGHIIAAESDDDLAEESSAQAASVMVSKIKKRNN